MLKTLPKGTMVRMTQNAPDGSTKILTGKLVRPLEPGGYSNFTDGLGKWRIRMTEDGGLYHTSGHRVELVEDLIAEPAAEPVAEPTDEECAAGPTDEEKEAAMAEAEEADAAAGVVYESSLPAPDPDPIFSTTPASLRTDSENNDLERRRAARREARAMTPEGQIEQLTLDLRLAKWARETAETRLSQMKNNPPVPTEKDLLWMLAEQSELYGLPLGTVRELTSRLRDLLLLHARTSDLWR